MTKVSQRADYTFKHNRKLERHGWLRLTPAYSVKLVRKLVHEMGVNKTKPFVLDPFSGTATTGVVAAEAGVPAHLFDINPFLVWLGNAKCANYSAQEIEHIEQGVNEVVRTYRRYLGNDNWVPKIHNIERWWSPQTLSILTAFRQVLVDVFGEPDDDNALAWIGFCKLAVDTSAAAFNHVSMSFYNDTIAHGAESIEVLFQAAVNSMLADVSTPLDGRAIVFYQDSREIQPTGTKYTHVITSPPYANRISYIRELRPYMYWTKFLKTAREAGELDWEAIGGTWGVATSRLKDWDPIVLRLPSAIPELGKAIQESGAKSAELMAYYVHKYFHDMFQHLDSLRQVLAPEAELRYIVGNSIFYGVRVETQDLLAEILSTLGYQNVDTEIIRKRNSKKELFEYCVSARHSPIAL